MTLLLDKANTYLWICKCAIILQLDNMIGKEILI